MRDSRLRHIMYSIAEISIWSRKLAETPDKSIALSDLPESLVWPMNRGPKVLLTYAMRAPVGIHHCQQTFLRGTTRARIRLRALTFSEYHLSIVPAPKDPHPRRHSAFFHVAKQLQHENRNVSINSLTS